MVMRNGEPPNLIGQSRTMSPSGSDFHREANRIGSYREFVQALFNENGGLVHDREWQAACLMCFETIGAGVVGLKGRTSAAFDRLMTNRLNSVAAAGFGAPHGAALMTSVADASFFFGR